MTEIEKSSLSKREGIIARAVRKAAEKLHLKYLEAEAQKQQIKIKSSETPAPKKSLEKVVTTIENEVKKHEWVTIKSKPTDEIKKHISSARGKGGALREIVSGALPQDEQLLQLLDEVAFMREAGATSDDALNFYQHNRGSVLGVEGEQDIYNRMWLVAREIPITPDALQKAATEGVGAAAATVVMPERWLQEFENPTDSGGNPLVLSGEATKIMKDLYGMRNTYDARKIAAEWGEIRELQSVPTINPDENAYLERVQREVKETFRAMNGDRLQIDPNTHTKLTKGPHAARERDKFFYERMRKILENPNEETHKQINLYDQIDMDTLMGEFSQAVEIDPKTGKEKKIGHMVQAHYQNYYDTILRLSDAEFWARHPAGDVENLSKSLGYFENKFAIEAMSDPFTEDMTQCMEMAIKFVRDANDGTIPAELSRYNPRTQLTYIDELTLQFFKQRIEGGALKDYVRDPHTGIPELDPKTEGRTYKRSDRAFHFEGLEEEEKQLRMLATLRLSKGVGIITNRTIELYAFTRTPGVDMDAHSGSMAGFSSKAYGGLTRTTNPLSEWFEMYQFGDTLFPSFFNSLMGAEGKPFKWSMDQYREVMDIIMKGGGEKLLRDKFGPNAKRLMDMINEFSFSGRFGPLSMWGTKDATLDWTTKECERLGGSMRLSLAETWAEKRFEEKFKNKYEAEGWSPSKIKDEWQKAKLGEENWKKDNEWKQQVDQYTETYRTLIWSEYVLRNPLGAAASQLLEYKSSDGKTHQWKLKSKILHDIFKEEDLKPFGLTEQLVVERDVASLRSLSTKKRVLMQRIALIDSDLGSVTRYAMNNEQFPRDIKPTDFETCIKGELKVELPDGTMMSISENTRRRQAKEFWERTQKEIFGKVVGDTSGGYSASEIRQQLGVTGDISLLKPHQIEFKTLNNLEAIVNNQASSDASVKLKDILQQKILVHLGTEDTQWSYLDLDTLGDRHWGRRGGDNLTRAKSLQLMMGFFHKLVGKPKMEDLVKAIAEIGQSEKGHDPKEAAKFAYIWGNATSDQYRQRKLAGLPIIGRLLPLLGIHMSIAQEKMGNHSANFWSVNNMVKFSDLLGETRVIPYKRVIDGKDFGPYTMKKFRKDIGANRIAAAAEMILIGYALTAVATMFLAADKSLEDEKKK